MATLVHGATEGSLDHRVQEVHVGHPVNALNLVNIGTRRVHQVPMESRGLTVIPVTKSVDVMAAQDRQDLLASQFTDTMAQREAKAKKEIEEEM